MKVKSRPIIVNETMQELTEHGTPEFPVSMDRQLAASSDIAHIPHWHYEVQISVVTHGVVIFRTQQEDYMIREGEGIFINSTCIHEVIPGDDARNTYVCVNFHPKVIGENGGLVQKNYVDPVLFSPELQSIPLNSAPWHHEICAKLLELSNVAEEQAYGYEMEMHILLTQIWYILVFNNRTYTERHATSSFTDRKRMITLQQFIHSHYMDSISLADIAASAHISRGECCRIFRRMKNTTPILYLLAFRIEQSTKLLLMTDYSVTEIAQRVGFGSSSYFTECFKKHMNCTPLVYRRNNCSKGKTDDMP